MARVDVKNAFSALPSPCSSNYAKDQRSSEHCGPANNESMIRQHHQKGDEREVQTSSGVKQGCPMASFVFTVYSILKRVLENERLFHAAFVDDIAIVPERYCNARCSPRRDCCFTFVDQPKYEGRRVRPRLATAGLFHLGHHILALLDPEDA